MKTIIAKIKKFLEKYPFLLFVVSFIPITFFYFFKLDKIPYGLFCDEAGTGVRAYELIHKNYSSFISPLFYNHFGYHIGTLPIYTTLPFVKLFGLSDFSIRASSVFLALFSLLLVYQILNLIGSKYKIFSVLLFAFTPIFFHISRTDIGHLPSIFFLLLGYFFFLQSQKKEKLILTVFSGISFGVSLYGYSGFVISTPLFVVFIAIAEIIKNGFKSIKEYKKIFLVVLIVLLFTLPIITKVLNDPGYLKRLSDKNKGNVSFLSAAKLKTILSNYPKYYSYDYLFGKGEIDLPGAFITRHSVRGNGIFLKISLLLILFSLLGMLVEKKKEKLPYLPFLFLFILYPIPDLLTTKTGTPPYSFSIFSTIYFLPFLAAYSLEFINRLLNSFGNKKTLLFIALYSILLIESINFLTNYQKYPLYSSDYWGWQYGPKEIIKYFILEKDQYDAFYMTGFFNEPQIFFSFYDPKHLCQNCFIGGINNYDPNKKQLFAVRINEMEEINKTYPDLTFNIVRSIYLPNNKAEYNLGYLTTK